MRGVFLSCFLSDSELTWQKWIGLSPPIEMEPVTKINIAEEEVEGWTSMPLKVCLTGPVCFI